MGSHSVAGQLPGSRTQLTNAAATAALAEHGTRRAAARALGVNESTVRRALARTDPDPVPEPERPARVLSVVMVDADPGDGRVPVHADQLRATAATLRRAQSALRAGDACAADRLLARAASTVVLLAALPPGRA